MANVWNKYANTAARKHGKPCLVVHELNGADAAAGCVQKFLKQHRIDVLNVAGPRESHAPGLGKFVYEVLGQIFSLA